jgi:hypothetical protein
MVTNEQIQALLTAIECAERCRANYVLKKGDVEIIRSCLNDALWQPIETAPKDGRWCLFHYSHEFIPVIDFWSEEKGDWIRGPFYDGYKYTHWKKLDAPSLPAAVSSVPDVTVPAVQENA